MNRQTVALLSLLGSTSVLAQNEGPTEAEDAEAEDAEAEDAEAEDAEAEDAEAEDAEAEAPGKVEDIPKDKADLVLTETQEEEEVPPDEEGWEFDFVLMGGSGLPRSEFAFGVNFEGQAPAVQAELGFSMQAPFMSEKTDPLTLRYGQDVFVARQGDTVEEGGQSLEGSATVVSVTAGGESVEFEAPMTLGPLAFRPFVMGLVGGYRFQWDGGSVGGETHTELGEQNGHWKLGYESGLGVIIGPNPDRWHRAVTPSLVFRYDQIDIESDLALGHMIVSGLILGLPMAAVQLVADAKLDERPMLRDALKIASQAAASYVGHTLLHDNHNWPWTDLPTLAYERPVAALRLDW